MIINNSNINSWQAGYGGESLIELEYPEAWFPELGLNSILSLAGGRKHTEADYARDKARQLHEIAKFFARVDQQISLQQGQQSHLKFAAPSSYSSNFGGNWLLNNEAQVRTVLFTGITQYLNKHTDAVPFVELTLSISPEDLESPEFQQLMAAVNNSTIKKVNLDFSKYLKNFADSQSALNQEALNAIVQQKLSAIAEVLTTKIAPQITFPLTVEVGEVAKYDSEFLSRSGFHDTRSSSLRQALRDINYPTLFKQFTAAVISNMQAHNRFTETVARQRPAASSESSAGAYPADKIKLKRLIWRKDRTQDLGARDHLKIELQHVADVAVDHTAAIVAETRLEIRSEMQQAEYTGPIVDYATFTQSYYQPEREQGQDPEAYEADQVVQHELFSNFPHGINGLSPAAAMVIGKNLPGYASLNAANLPENFVIRIHPSGKQILDFDPAAAPRETSVYTPKPNIRHPATAPIYPVQIADSSIAPWCFNGEAPNPPSNASLYTSGSPMGFGYTQSYGENRYKQFDNLWARFGDVGVQKFFGSIKNCEIGSGTAANPQNPNLADFLHKHYLAYFPRWDLFLDDDAFFNCLQRIQKYDATKVTCLQKFLENTGYSRHDLHATLDAFDQFWADWQRLCTDNNVALDAVNANWETPIGGNPIVYMERLATILKNARNLQEQCDNLAGLKLDNYGAYYASKYEGFTLVSPKMQFDFKQKATKDYKPNANVYRVELEDLQDYVRGNLKTNRNFASHSVLINCTDDNIDLANAANYQIKPYTEADFVPPFRQYLIGEDKYHKICDKLPITHEQLMVQIYRYLAVHKKAISIPRLDECISSWRSYEYRKLLVTFMFFVGHEGYTEDITSKVDVTHDYRPIGGEVLIQNVLLELLESIDKLSGHDDQQIWLSSIIEVLTKLHKVGIRFSPEEGLALIKGYVCETNDSVNTDGIKKIYPHIIKDKYAVTRFLKFIRENRETGVHSKDVGRMPGYYHIQIYITDFLGADLKIAEKYANNLLMFSAMYIPEYFSFDPYSPGEKTQLLNAGLETLKGFMHQAATGPENNNLDLAFNIIFRSQHLFMANDLLAALPEIAKLAQVDENQVKTILRKHNIRPGAGKTETFTHSAVSVQAAMVSLIMLLRTNSDAPDAVTDADLFGLDMQALQQIFVQTLEELGLVKRTLIKASLQLAYSNLKNLMVAEEFKQLGDSEFVKQLTSKIQALPCLAPCDGFTEIKQSCDEAASIAGKFAMLTRRDNFIAFESEFTKLFASVDLSIFKNNSFNMLLDLLLKMPQKHYLGILQQLFKHTDIIKSEQDYAKLLELIDQLRAHDFPSIYIEKIVQLAKPGAQLDVLIKFTDNLYQPFAANKDDVLLNWMLGNKTLKFEQLAKIAELTTACKQYREPIQHLLAKLQANKQLDAFLAKIAEYPGAEQVKILEMIARSEACDTTKTRGNIRINYVEFATRIHALGADTENLYNFYQQTTPGASCLYSSLQKLQPIANFQQFINSFEKAPFGRRNFKQQFDSSEAERVVNGFVDLNNHSAYSYTYRKQMLEAFMFVNRAGYDLPVYNNKPAHELSNAEIQQIFQQMRAASLDKPEDRLRQRVYALALMREAMYRATGQFPYSTQMLALIDCMLHEGDLIQNIDTGQGKSLIDAMKASLLWLETGRVDVTTSSMVDAQRDIENCGPFFGLLGIKYAATPINTNSAINDYKTDGINYSTMAQFALFYSKVKADPSVSAADQHQREVICSPDSPVSLVMNESDYTILDDQTIYRYATPEGVAVKVATQDEWIYTALNRFVTEDVRFFDENNSKDQDLALLRDFINKHYPPQTNRQKDFIRSLNDEQLLIWINSALIVNYDLREKYDYMLSTEEEIKKIRGVERKVLAAKILMTNGKFSQDMTYGDGMQQLLHAKYNALKHTDIYAIEPETKTIISLNNRNMIDFYRTRKGYIWGSSGTVGSDAEISQQYIKYGFEFSKNQPHQLKRVQHTPQHISNDQQQQFALITKRLLADYGKSNAPPSLVFFKDIPTAEAFEKYFREHSNPRLKDHFLQLYTGSGNEPQVLEKAKTAGMVTITTSAMGRNTDIEYSKTTGMTVYQTFIDTVRNIDQRSGRTGRQGSYGIIHTILSLSDYPGKTKQNVATQLQENEIAAEAKRKFNEEFYNVIGYLLRQVDTLPAAKRNDPQLYTVVWADFSNYLEQKYRDQKHSGAYLRATFIEDAVNEFNKRFPDCILEQSTLQAFLDWTPTNKSLNNPYTKTVTMADCIPAEITAYHYLNKQMLNLASRNAEIEVVSSPANVKTFLDKIFKAKNKINSAEALKTYITYLNTPDLQLHAIRANHHQYMQDLLADPSELGSNTKLVRRWLGFQGPLTKITSDRNYLIMFKVLSDLHFENTEQAVDPQQTLIAVRSSVRTLMDEYLNNSWFISPAKREAAQKLYDAVTSETTLPEVIQLIMQCKLDVAGSDIINQRAPLRKIKPINVSGHSRLQASLDNALALTAALTGEDVNQTQLDLLAGKIQATETKSLDSYKAAQTLIRYKDKSNAAVVDKSIEAILTRKKPAETGMQRRPDLPGPKKKK